MVSVIIPTFKRRDMLFFEIEQLKLQQNVDIEIIVINDNIKDDPTDEIITRYPYVKYVKYPYKIGPGQKRQVGYKMAKGQYISTPDDDDYLIDIHFFEKAETIMNNDDTISFVSGGSIIKYEGVIDELQKYEEVPLNISGKIDGIDYLENMQGNYTKPLSSFPTVFRRNAFEKQNFLDQIEMSDVSLYMLACLSGNAFFIDDLVGVYRIHSRSLTTKKSSPKWINNVLRQKELVFCQIKDRLSSPSTWWLRHINLSYHFYANTSKDRFSKLKLLSWCFLHSHGYPCVIRFVIKQIYFAIIKNN